MNQPFLGSWPPNNDHPNPWLLVATPKWCCPGRYLGPDASIPNFSVGGLSENGFYTQVVATKTRPYNEREHDDSPLEVSVSFFQTNLFFDVYLMTNDVLT